ncbi:MAG: hypothetical protein CV087_22525 [Candidatus Brocadia sp. WS118]|nr:MAG: hypothetical protein CV087_22525 [Candidatus Brocadia sp. WS118]
MGEQKEKTSWWQTIPGILTGIAAIITALGGLIAVLYQSGVFGEKSSPAAPVKEPAETHSKPSSVTPSNEPHTAISQDSLSPESKQVRAGHYIFKLLGSALQPYSAGPNGQPLKFSLRLSIRVTDVMGVSDYVDRRTIRLSVDGAEYMPENSINFAVYDKQSVETEALFIIPADATVVELLVGRPEDPTARIPLTLHPQ